MGKVEGLEKLKADLRRRTKDAKKGTVNNKATVTVGYTQAYAIYVHENLEAAHEVGGAKFLERPFRAIEPQAAAFLNRAMASGMSLDDALVLLGLRLQRESQEEVPVDTGALKASAFTRKGQ